MEGKAALPRRVKNTLTRRYNVRHRKWGRLFGDRYKAVVVDGGDQYHYQTLMDYIHLNPVRARIIRPKARQSVLDYPWCSIAGGYALPPKRRAKWLDVASGLKEFGLPDSVSGRRQMVERLDHRSVSEEIASCGVPPQDGEVDARSSHLRRGRYWGGQAFGESMRKLAAALMKKAAPKRRKPNLLLRCGGLAEIPLNAQPTRSGVLHAALDFRAARGGELRPRLGARSWSGGGCAPGDGAGAVSEVSGIRWRATEG
jgi:hypothetical protein